MPFGIRGPIYEMIGHSFVCDPLFTKQRRRGRCRHQHKSLHTIGLFGGVQTQNTRFIIEMVIFTRIKGIVKQCPRVEASPKAHIPSVNRRPSRTWTSPSGRLHFPECLSPSSDRTAPLLTLRLGRLPRRHRLLRTAEQYSRPDRSEKWPL